MRCFIHQKNKNYRRHNSLRGSLSRNNQNFKNKNYNKKMNPLNNKGEISRCNFSLMNTNKLKLLKVIAVLNLVIANLRKVLKRLKIPVIIVGLQATVTKDVVEYDIPLLLSKEAMKKTKTQIYFQEDNINTFGKNVQIYFTSTGHYCIKLKSKLSDENVFKTNAVFLCSNIHNLSSTEKY